MYEKGKKSWKEREKLIHCDARLYQRQCARSQRSMPLNMTALAPVTVLGRVSQDALSGSEGNRNCITKWLSFHHHSHSHLTIRVSPELLRLLVSDSLSSCGNISVRYFVFIRPTEIEKHQRKQKIIFSDHHAWECNNWIYF